MLQHLGIFTHVCASVCWDRKSLFLCLCKDVVIIQKAWNSASVVHYFNLTNWNRWPRFETESLVGIDFNLSEHMRPIQ